MRQLRIELPITMSGVVHGRACERTDLARVHDVQRVNGVLDCPHELDSVLSQFSYEVLLLADPDSVLAGACEAVESTRDQNTHAKWWLTCAIQGDRAMHEPVHGVTDRLQLAILLEQDERMEVTCSTFTMCL